MSLPRCNCGQEQEEEEDANNNLRCPTIGIDVGNNTFTVSTMIDNQVRIVCQYIKPTNSSENPLAGGQLWLGTSEQTTTKKNKINGKSNLAKHSIENRIEPIYNWKRLIGQRFDDPDIQEYVENLSFKIDYFNTEINNVSPEQVMAIIFTDIRVRCESYFNDSALAGAMICVPASFNSAQRRGILEAARMARLKVLQLINEPTASVIAYRYNCGKESPSKFSPSQSEDEEEQVPLPLQSNIVLFDLGGSSLDISIVSIDQTRPSYDKFRVLSTSGDTDFGGENFDQKLYEHFWEQVRNETNGVDRISDDPMVVDRLRTECKKSRHLLSQFTEDQLDFWLDNDEAEVEVEDNENRNWFGKPGHEYIPLMLQRDELNGICEKLYLVISKHLDRAIYDSGLELNEIDDIVLVGGVSQQPAIRQLIQKYFLGKVPNIAMDPYSTCANGAAIHASWLIQMLNVDESNLENDEPVIQEICSRTILVEIDDKLQILFQQNDQLPIAKTLTLPTKSTKMINIYESYSSKFDDCFSMTYQYELCRNSRRLQPSSNDDSIDVVFSVDENGILNVDCHDDRTILNRFLSF